METGDNSTLPITSRSDELAGVIMSIMEAWEPKMPVNACPSCGNSYNECACRERANAQGEASRLTEEHRIKHAPYVIKHPQNHVMFEPNKVSACAKCGGVLEQNAAGDRECVCKNRISFPRRETINPPHYKRGGIECIDVIEAWELGYNLGNALKYLCRAGHKGERCEDLRKARWYLEREIEKS